MHGSIPLKWHYIIEALDMGYGQSSLYSIINLVMGKLDYIF